MPKKSAASDYEFSNKTNRDIKTGRLRQRESHDRLVASLGRLKEVQGCPSARNSEAVSLAVENLANQSPGGLLRFLAPLAFVFLEPLEYRLGEIKPVDHYWEKFIGAVESYSAQFAKALLAGNCEHNFRWLVFGHLQRLAVEYQALPESVTKVEIYEDASGKLTAVAVCNDGESFILPDDYYNEAPEIYFPGESFILPVHPENTERLIWTPDDLKSGPMTTAKQTLLANVGLPDDMAPTFQRMKRLPSPEDAAKLRRP